MKIFTAGSTYYMAQLPRIDKGFTTLGHDLVEHMGDADLLYANDSSHYKDILSAQYGGRLKPSARIIFNVLDIPEHLLPDYDLEGLERMLSHAHAVTSISIFVQDQLIRYLSRGSHVIYQPIMPITHSPVSRPDRYTRYLSASRRHDPNKRFRLGVQALQLLGVNYGQLGLAGEDFANWGEYLGKLTDEQLNTAFNSVDFVLALGKVEGLSLNVIESMASGTIPIVLNDMTTRKELLPPDLFPEYDDVHPTPTSISRFVARYLGDNHEMLLMKARLHSHYLKVWKDRVSPVGVAQAILNVYERIKP